MDNQIKRDYRARDARRPQRQHAVPEWRVPNPEEQGFIKLHWEPIFRRMHSPKLNTFFAICFGFNCVVFGLLAPIILFVENLLLGVLFGLFALGFGALTRNCVRQNRESKRDLNNIINGKYEVAIGHACHLEVIQFTAGSSHTEEQYAFVDIWTDSGNILVENIEIPFHLGKVLLERSVDSFPCLVIHINDRQELIALPKFK